MPEHRKPGSGRLFQNGERVQTFVAVVGIWFAVHVATLEIDALVCL
jgi:hypothetical protein